MVILILLLFPHTATSLAVIFTGKGTRDQQKVFSINLGSVDLGWLLNNRESFQPNSQ